MPSPTPKTQTSPILAINRGQKDIEPPPPLPPPHQPHRPTRKPQSPCPSPQKRCREAGRLQPRPEVNLAPRKPLPAVRSQCKVHGGLFWSTVVNFPASLISWTSYAPLFEH